MLLGADAKHLPVAVGLVLFRRSIWQVILALVAGVSTLTSAEAQQAPEAPTVLSPLRIEPDHNGVNLATGKVQVSMPVLSVPGSPRLRFDRVQNAAPYVKGRILQGSPGATRNESYSIHTGTGSSEAFECIDYDCNSVTISGSTFTPNSRIYREGGTGAVYTFSLQHVQTTGPDQTLLYYASQVTYPSGETLTYSYYTTGDTGDPLNRTYYRPVTITSNLGYFISLTYQSNVFGTAEWGTVGQATLYKSSAPTTPLARLSYSTDGTITDLGGREFKCEGCTNTLGVDVEVSAGKIWLPGESAPSLQYTTHPTAPLVAGVTRDGVQWNYAYINLRFDPATDRYLFDKVTVTGPNGYSIVYNMTVSAKQNMITSMVDSLGRTTSYEYDSGYRLTRIVFPELNEVRVAYDDYGNVVEKRTKAKPGSGLADLVETAWFAGSGCTGVLCYRPKWSRDALGRQTDFAYNPSGQLIERTDPADSAGVRRKTYITYDAGGRATVTRICGDTTTCGTSAELRTEYEYWEGTSFPSVQRQIDALAGETREVHSTYDPAIKAMFGPNSKTAFEQCCR